ELTELNRQQAELPECSEKISNPHGTAPGMWFDGIAMTLMSMPGVPHVLIHMIQTEDIPRIGRKLTLPVIVHQMIRMAGIGESFLADKIASWERSLPPHIRLAYLPNEGGVKLRLTAIGEDEEKIRKEFAALRDSILPLAGQYIFGFSDEPLEVVLGKLLIEKGLTLSAAESCTGGHVSHTITSVPG